MNRGTHARKDRFEQSEQEYRCNQMLWTHCFVILCTLIRETVKLVYRAGLRLKLGFQRKDVEG